MKEKRWDYLEGLFGLEGKVALVIGGGGHICSEVALSLSRAGCSVAVADLRLHKAEKVAERLAEESGKTDRMPQAFQIDVSSKSSHQSLLAEVLKKFGGLDIAVNGAGINSSTPFFDLSLEEWRKVTDSQITGTFLGCQVYGAYMVGKKSGSIINISSASADPPLSKAFPYSVAKAGIANLTQNLAREWGKTGVRVNAVRPGFFPTEWNVKNFITPERERDIFNHTPMGRFGKVEELVGAFLWLASSASSFVTGAEIRVDGGFSCMTI